MAGRSKPKTEAEVAHSDALVAELKKNPKRVEDLTTAEIDALNDKRKGEVEKAHASWVETCKVVDKSGGTRPDEPYFVPAGL